MDGWPTKLCAMPRACEDRAHAVAQARAVIGDALQRIGLVENLAGVFSAAASETECAV